MYRGKKKKLLLFTGNFKILQIDTLLVLEVKPIVGTSILFLEDDGGTKICLVRNDKVITEFIHPFIKPSMIIDKGRLIPDAFKAKYKTKIEKAFDIEFYNENKFNSLNAVEKLYYVEKTWDLTHSVVYTLLF